MDVVSASFLLWKSHEGKHKDVEKFNKHKFTQFPCNQQTDLQGTCLVHPDKKIQCFFNKIVPYLSQLHNI